MSEKKLNRRKKGKMKRLGWRENAQQWCMALPGIFLVFLFHYVPLPGIVIAFKKFNPNKGIFGSEWAGLQNFEFFFASRDALRTIRNTILYSVDFLVVNLITAVGLALMFYFLKSRRALKFYNTVVIIPRFMSMVIIAYIVYALLSPSYGVVNRMLIALGGEGISWYMEAKYWPFILTIVYVWQSVGMSSVLYYASLMGMDNSLIEAAKMDGANLRQQIWHVLIPHLIPIIIITTILAIGGLFSGSMDLFYQVPKNQGVLYSTTDIINTYTYRALVNGNMANSAAVNLFQNAVGFVLVIGANLVVKRISPENSFF